MGVLPERIAGTGARTLETAKPRLALRVNLAAIEGGSFLFIANDLVRRVQLGEFGGCPGILFFSIGMQLLGKFAVRLLDVSRIGRLRHPQDLIGVAHPSHSNSAKNRRHGRPCQLPAMWESEALPAMCAPE